MKGAPEDPEPVRKGRPVDHQNDSDRAEAAGRRARKSAQGLNPNNGAG